MTSEAAIFILTEMSKNSDNLSVEDMVKAVKLGIEALKLLQMERRDSVSYAGELLLGETED